MLPRAIAALVLTPIVLVLSVKGAVAAATPTDQIWLVASDIHLDPFNRSADPSLFGSDTNVALFRSALAAMKRRIPNPSLVLLPGDFLAHEFDRRVPRGVARGSPGDERIATMRFIAGSFNRAFPRASFAIAVGNNDAPCGDYRSAVDTAYLASIARIWAPLVNRRGSAPLFEASFGRLGSYTMSLPLRSMRLIALNDVPFSAEYLGNCGETKEDPTASEIAWLRVALATTPSNARNVVLMHVPPGYDALSTERTKGFVPWPFLNRAINETLLSELSDPTSKVAYTLAGHAHRFDFRLDDGIPILVFGSVSPIYHNNPAFYALHVRSDGSLRDIDVYAYDEWTKAWQPARSFDGKWHVATIDAPALSALHAKLEANAPMRRAWDVSSSGWPSNWNNAWGMWGASWRTPWCAQTELRKGFAQCAGLTGRAAIFQIVIAIAGALGLALVTGAFLFVRRATSHRRLSAQSDR